MPDSFEILLDSHLMQIFPPFGYVLHTKQNKKTILHSGNKNREIKKVIMVNVSTVIKDMVFKNGFSVIIYSPLTEKSKIIKSP